MLMLNALVAFLAVAFCLCEHVSVAHLQALRQRLFKGLVVRQHHGPHHQNHQHDSQLKVGV